LLDRAARALPIGSFKKGQFKKRPLNFLYAEAKNAAFCANSNDSIDRIILFEQISARGSLAQRSHKRHARKENHNLVPESGSNREFFKRPIQKKC